MAFSNDTVVPKIISAHMRQSFNESTVYSAHTNRAWESELTGGPGDRVVINVPSATSAIGDHAIGTALVYTEVDVGTPVTLAMDKKKEFKLMYNDINALQSIPDVLAEAGRVQGRHLAEQIDKDVFAVMTTASTGATVATALALIFGTDNDVADIPWTTWHRTLDIAAMPREGRWVVVGPYTAEYIYKSLIGKNAAGVYGDQQVGKNGFIGHYAGFNIFTSNAAVTTAYSASAKTATETLLFGIDYATAFALQLAELEAIRLESFFADAIRGLNVYGSVVIEQKGLYKCVASLTKVPA